MSLGQTELVCEKESVPRVPHVIGVAAQATIVLNGVNAGIVKLFAINAGVIVGAIQQRLAIGVGLVLTGEHPQSRGGVDGVVADKDTSDHGVGEEGGVGLGEAFHVYILAPLP